MSAIKLRRVPTSGTKQNAEAAKCEAAAFLNAVLAAGGFKPVDVYAASHAREFIVRDTFIFQMNAHYQKGVVFECVGGLTQSETPGAGLQRLRLPLGDRPTVFNKKGTAVVDFARINPAFQWQFPYSVSPVAVADTLYLEAYERLLDRHGATLDRHGAERGRIRDAREHMAARMAALGFTKHRGDAYEMAGVSIHHDAAAATIQLSTTGLAADRLDDLLDAIGQLMQAVSTNETSGG